MPCSAARGSTSSGARTGATWFTFLASSPAPSSAASSCATATAGAMRSRRSLPRCAGRPTPSPGNACSAVGIFRDMSEKYALEQLRADFLSMITHDIKVPLTVILGYTEMLTDPEPPPVQIPPEVLTRIRESGETIHGLVCNFLDLSRIEAGRMTLDPRPFDLAEMLAHAVEHYSSTARRKGVRLALETGPLTPLVADEPQLQRVVANLLGNAITYTATGACVTVSTARQHGPVAVALPGTGRGIPAEEIP